MTACGMETVLSGWSEIRVSACLEKSDETPVVLVTLPTQGCWLEAILCRY